MPYYKCEKCLTKVCGWGIGSFCSSCGNELTEISKEEFEEEKKEEDKSDD